jgi:flagellar basal-body rod protein FlgG
MANGIFSAAAGMAAQQTRLDAIANDLANTSTTGYKAERVAFADLVYTPEDGVPVGSGVATIDAGRSFAAGALQDSNDPLSLAIDGPGFFQVRRSDGTPALTRAGDFQLDAAGSLVTSAGEQLVPPVKVPRGTDPSDVTISGDGSISVKGKTIGKIDLVDVASPDSLVAAGGSLYTTTKASGAATPANGSSLVQGQLESSNVDVADSMTELMDAQQTYSLSSRALQIQDQLLQIANELKR